MSGGPDPWYGARRLRQEHRAQRQVGQPHPGGLIDMTRFRNMPYLELGTPTRVEYIEAWEAATGVTVSAGDAVVIRTGRWAGRAEVGPPGTWPTRRPGWLAVVIPRLRKPDIAILGGERWPPRWMATSCS